MLVRTRLCSGWCGAVTGRIFLLDMCRDRHKLRASFRSKHFHSCIYMFFLGGEENDDRPWSSIDCVWVEETGLLGIFFRSVRHRPSDFFAAARFVKLFYDTSPKMMASLYCQWAPPRRWLSAPLLLIGFYSAGLYVGLGVTPRPVSHCDRSRPLSAERANDNNNSKTSHTKKRFIMSLGCARQSRCIIHQNR